MGEPYNRTVLISSVQNISSRFHQCGLTADCNEVCMYFAVVTSYVVKWHHKIPMFTFIACSDDSTIHTAYETSMQHE